MKIQSVSTHHCADGGVGEVLSPQNTLGVSGLNSDATKSNTIEEISYQIFRRNKTTEIHNMPPYCLWVSASLTLVFDSNKVISSFNPKSPPEVATLADVIISDGPRMHLVGRRQWNQGRNFNTNVRNFVSQYTMLYPNLLPMLQVQLPLESVEKPVFSLLDQGGSCQSSVSY